MWTWYLTRGSGAAALLLLTASVAIGAGHTLRWRSRSLPRFVVDDVHRTVSTVALVLVGAHVVTSVLDSFAPVSVFDAFIPFVGTYRPTWLGLGAAAFDLMLIVAVTSAYRASLGYKTWRAIHWVAYACWPIALMHSLGTGSDIKRGWMLGLGVACAGIVVIVAGARLWQAQGPYAHIARPAGALGLVAAAIALAAWLPHGPLGHGWARRAGTPLALLIPKRTAFAAAPAKAAPQQRVAGTRTIEAPARQVPLIADASGVIHQGTDNNGTALVDIALTVSAPERRRLDVRIAGIPQDGGGVVMERSQVTFGPPHDPARYVGSLTSLEGTRMEARLRPLRGRTLDLTADLGIDRQAGQVQGRIDVRPVG